MTMTTAELVKKYGICISRGGLMARWGEEVARDNMQDELMARKQEVMDYLNNLAAEKERAAAERERKLNGIEGLQELRNAISTAEGYAEAFSVAMQNEDQDGAFMPQKPKNNVAALRERYPRAAAYIKAESWSFASNDAKSSAGRKAKESILNGDDYTQALEQMEKEWTDYCNDHIWD